MIQVTPDVMTFLHDKYKQATKLDSAEINDFVAFCRNYFDKVNKPINVTYLQVGLGLRLQSGETVGFAVDNSLTIMKDEGVRVTQPKTVPGMHGITDTSGIHI